MFILFRSLRESVVLADSVLADLQGGNLKARFPVRSKDEIGRVMSRFNRMADEIERLVEQIRGVEKSRMALLQELAHDLRTPVASLKNLLETLDAYQLSEAKKSGEKDPVGVELVTLAIKEVEYFERLVEDLLVLAQVSEPRYRSGKDQVLFNELLEDEADGVGAAHESRSKSRFLRLPFMSEATRTFSGEWSATGLRTHFHSRRMKYPSASSPWMWITVVLSLKMMAPDFQKKH